MSESDGKDKPASATTVREHDRVLALIAAQEVNVVGENYVQCELEGIIHPSTMRKWLPILHMAVKSRTSKLELARLMQTRVSIVRQHLAIREQRLYLLHAQRKIKFEQIIT